MANDIDPLFQGRVKARVPLEKNIEKAYRDWCKSRGWQTLKCTPMGNQGYPDRQILFGDGRVAWLELKRPKNKPTPLQYERIHILLSAGYIAGWADTLQSAKIFTELAHAILFSSGVDAARISKDCAKFYPQPNDVEPAARRRRSRPARPRHGKNRMHAAVDI